MIGGLSPWRATPPVPLRSTPGTRPSSSSCVPPFRLVQGQALHQVAGRYCGDRRTWGRGPRHTRCERQRAEAGSFAARIEAWADAVTWSGLAASTYLVRTAGGTWVRYLGRVPPAPIRAASLSYLETWGRVEHRYRCRSSEVAFPAVRCSKIYFVNSSISYPHSQSCYLHKCNPTIFEVVVAFSPFLV